MRDYLILDWHKISSYINSLGFKNYAVIIELVKSERTTVCENKHSYSCSDTICAKRNESCAHAPRRGYSLISAVKFVKFKARIAKCLVKSYAWNVDDFCANGIGCQEIQCIRTLGSHYYRKKAACRCKGRLGYHCDGWACAVDSRACDVLKLKYPNFRETKAVDKKEIKLCRNDDLLFRNQLSLF